MVVAQVQDLNVVVELEQVAELGRVLEAVELVVGQVELSQVHVHLQGGGCARAEEETGVRGHASDVGEVWVCVCVGWGWGVLVPCSMSPAGRCARLTQQHQRSARQAGVLQVKDGQAAADPERSGHEGGRVVQQGGVPSVQVLQRTGL